MILRLPLALLLALLVSLSIFLFMQSLIQTDASDLAAPEQLSVVELFKPPEPQDQPEPEPEPREPLPSEPAPAEPEPTMEPLQAAAPQAPAQPAVEQMMPPLEMGTMAIETGSSGDAWSTPLTGGGGAAKLLEQIGQDNQGFVEVVPFSTRKPNIPELAWKNKRNGWVLVAFNVTPKGYVTNVRVLDASPKGLFEQTVVNAVSDWRFQFSGNKPIDTNLVLTQKIELFWKDYPLNIKGYD